jgi:hypothetical protein
MIIILSRSRHAENISEKFGDFAGELFDNFGEGFPNNFPSYIEYLDQQVGSNSETFINAHTRTPIKCLPKPGKLDEVHLIS